jgi:hypothetical protein
MRSAAFGSVGVRPRQIADSTRPNSRNSRQAPPPVIADFCNKIGHYETSPPLPACLGTNHLTEMLPQIIKGCPKGVLWKITA